MQKKVPSHLSMLHLHKYTAYLSKSCFYKSFLYYEYLKKPRM